MASDADVRARLAQADVVASGVVSATSRVAAARPPLSHHGPDWWRATVNVETVEKGDVAAKTMTVLFANSMDLAWSRSPKLKSGDRCVLLLQSRDHFGRPVPERAVVDPLDVQPIGELEHVRSLLKGGRTQE